MPVETVSLPLQAPLAGARYRLRFRKDGDLRLVSHHDLMHVFERMLRRADLPITFSRGFNPRAKITFAQSLALGLVGCAEVAELELQRPLSAEDIAARLSSQAPPGLEILSVQPLAPKQRARVHRAGYRVSVPARCRAEVPQRIADLLAAPACWIERTRPQRRRLDLRPFIDGLRLAGEFLEMELWMSPNGAARPEEICQLLGLDDVLAAGAVIERHYLELQDEVATATRMPANLGASKHTNTGLSAPASSAEAAAAHGAPQPTSLIDSPMAFDS